MANVSASVEELRLRKGETVKIKLDRKVIVLHGDGTTEVWKDNGRVFDRDGRL